MSTYISKYKKKDESYPQNLFYAIYGRQLKNPPSNFEENLEKAFLYIKEHYNLGDRYCNTIIRYFKDNVSTTVIAKEINRSPNRAWQDIDKIIYILRHPQFNYLYTGIIEESQPITESSNIDSLNLTARAYNRLRHTRIYTIGDLINKTESDILRIFGLGTKGLDDIKQKLDIAGFHLREETEEPSNLKEESQPIQKTEEPSNLKEESQPIQKTELVELEPLPKYINPKHMYPLKSQFIKMRVVDVYFVELMLDNDENKCIPISNIIADSSKEAEDIAKKFVAQTGLFWLIDSIEERIDLLQVLNTIVYEKRIIMQDDL